MGNRAYLLQGASYNDSLLQNYRGFHLRLQAIFVAIGTGLALAVVNAKDSNAAKLAAVVLVFQAAASLLTAVQLRAITRARGVDVDYWHRLLILEEQDLAGPERYFTRFKIHQKSRRTDITEPEKQRIQELEKQMNLRRLEEDEIRALVEGGHGHTRTFLDRRLFDVFVAIWVILLGIAAYRIMLMHP